MKKTIYFLLISLFLLSCDKEKSLLEDINGNWILNGFSITDNEGIRYEGTSNGTFTINSSAKKYSIQLNYETVLLNDSYNYAGDFQLIKNNESMELTYIDSTNEIYTFEFKLIYASKDYLKIEYWDKSYRLNTLLLSR